MPYIEKPEPEMKQIKKAMTIYFHTIYFSRYLKARSDSFLQNELSRRYFKTLSRENISQKRNLIPVHINFKNAGAKQNQQIHKGSVCTQQVLSTLHFLMKNNMMKISHKKLKKLRRNIQCTIISKYLRSNLSQ